MSRETVRCSLPEAFIAPKTVPTTAQQSPTRRMSRMNHRIDTGWPTRTPQHDLGSSSPLADLQQNVQMVRLCRFRIAARVVRLAELSPPAYSCATQKKRKRRIQDLYFYLNKMVFKDLFFFSFILNRHYIHVTCAILMKKIISRCMHSIWDKNAFSGTSTHGAETYQPNTC